MRLINVKVVLEREELMKKNKQVDRRKEVLEFRDDETTDYAILSHRWIEQEVNYEEMVDLEKVVKEKQKEIRRRGSYQKILGTCEQAKKDGYEWLWVDTCCIDKRSSAELSEAINAMYRWYENSRVCYVYLHDVTDPSFPTAGDSEKYPSSKGWPAWFLRGWTLQEMIAPKDVQFFNKGWQPIGNKKTLTDTLARITGVAEHVLTGGLSFNCLCCSNHVMGCRSGDNPNRGPSVFLVGSFGCEHANVVWRREESIPPSSTGDHPHVQRSEHLCMGSIRKNLAHWQLSSPMTQAFSVAVNIWS